MLNAIFLGSTQRNSQKGSGFVSIKHPLVVVFQSANEMLCLSPLTEFRWNTSEWTECSKTCGGGSQIRNVSCLNISIPVTSQYIANPEMAIETETDTAMCAMCEKAGVRPTSRELCNIEDCPIWVAEEEFTEVSVTICPTSLYCDPFL